ncbi:MAG: SMP-30/Gluconolaconase/LRE-like region family protein 4 [Frankiales bacterium]|nr:SMP-30/Gluconolaconase/LRE-like region family protein 4 [Frankiales bacterium]
MTATPRVVASGFTFLEGPRWHRGALYVSDFHSRGVYAVTAGSAVAQLHVVPGTPSGLGFSPDDRLMVVSMTDNSVLIADPSSGELALHADLRHLQAGPANDMLVDGRGRAYIGCDGFNEDAGEPIRSAPLVFVDTAGNTSIVADDLFYPNGMALSPDGQTMYVAETLAARVSAFRVTPSGALEDRRVWATFDAAPALGSIADAIEELAILPDGLALDVNGNLWVADAKGCGVSLFSEGGDVIDRVATGELAVYAVALGGDDLRTLFMCAAMPLSARKPGDVPHAELLACRVSTPGVPTY